MLAKTLAHNAFNKVTYKTQNDTWQQFAFDDPADFFKGGYVFDPETGNPLQPHDEQYAVLEAFTQTDDNGDFLYNTWVYSAPKKSGKTTFTAGILLWQAWRIDNGYIAVVANDQKQSDSRMFRVIEYAVKHHPLMRDYAKVNRYKITLANGTVIEALPVDASGEAGMNPTAIAFTEVWGAKGDRAEMMWSESALAPNRAGQSFKLVESYAGHSGESLILERLYDSVVKSDYVIDAEREIYARKDVGVITYWCTRRIMSWQDVSNPTIAMYYANQRIEKTPNEYLRQHENQWVTSVDRFCRPEWWDARRVERNALTDGQNGVVIAIDAAVKNDCFAMVVVGRDGDVAHVLHTEVFKPPIHGDIDLEHAENKIVEYIKSHNVVCLAYDPSQMEYMAQRIKKLGIVWVGDFKQGRPRLEADKALRDRIQQGTIVHDGNPDLTEHVINANAKVDKEERTLRIVKRSESKKIDACVALSMACHVAGNLNIG